eukprot:m.196381 g.196381  ORF g.196381 m.196381 type:complete len:236 (+) comp17651_c0_seq4:75-782(+)
MTTAARPTWNAAVGGSGKRESGIGSLSKQYSVRDVTAHTKLKVRQTGQGTVYETANRDLKAELEQRERIASLKRKGGSDASEAAAATEASAPAIEEAAEEQDKRPHLMIQPNDLDRDDEIRDEDSDDDDESEEDDEDETAQLLRELQKIKRERAEEQARREAEKAAEREKINIENALTSNPLMRPAAAGDFSIKRRWDDDVVFKNCAKQDEKDHGFINDTLRSTFHRKFMSKYII